MTKRKIIPGEIETRDLHQFLLGSVSPRPIAFVSTRNSDGVDNLAPYSFFNCFSSNPPILVFSSNRRVRDNTTKDTLTNVQKHMECVINVVNYDIVRQMALASIEFPSEESEFVKSGLTPVEAEIVKAALVKESPVNMECRVNEIIPLGEHGGAGHLIICEMLAMHIDPRVIDPDNDRIDPNKIDLMGRMGRSYYVRASGDAIHTIVQAVTKISIGYDALSEGLRSSEILSANDLGRLAGLYELPSTNQIESLKKDYPHLSTIEETHQKIKELIEENALEEALALGMGV